jgi:hypothetical protein
MPYRREPVLKRSIATSFAFLLLGFQGAAQEIPWLTDDQAREKAAATVHPIYPQPCYSTYRDEGLEGFILNVRRNPTVGGRLNNSVYSFRVASDTCEYLTEENGKPVIHTQVSNDCCEYGIEAVDRATSKSYWFRGDTRREIFNEFVRDEQLRPDLPEPTLFAALYLELVWGAGTDKEIRSLEQLRDLVQQNFRPAYSPYEANSIWQRKFDAWWRTFRSKMPQLKLETTYETTGEGTLVRGYSFVGFPLTIPRSDPPPKGTPKLLQWALLVKPDGMVEEKPATTVYPPN